MIPSAFSSLQEANNSLQYQMNAYDEVEYKIIERQFEDEMSAVAQLSHHINQFNSWDKALNAFLSCHNLDAADMAKVKIFQLQHAYFLFTILGQKADGIPSEMGADSLGDIARRLLTLAQQAIGYSGQSLTIEVAAPRFAFGMNIVAPLYGLAHHCRDPVIRREALKLLKATRRHEGIWDGEKAAYLAETIIAIEERGLGPVREAADVPEAARIREIKIVFGDDGKIQKLGYKQGSQSSPETWFEEDIQAEILG